MPRVNLSNTPFNLALFGVAYAPKLVQRRQTVFFLFLFFGLHDYIVKRRLKIKGLSFIIILKCCKIVNYRSLKNSI